MNNYATAMLIAGLVLIGMSPVADAPRAQPDPRAARPTVDALDESLNEVVDRYCERCHSDQRMIGNMSLEHFDVTDPSADPELAEKVIHKLRAGMMPPARQRRPSGDTLDILAATLEGTLDEAARRKE